MSSYLQCWCKGDDVRHIFAVKIDLAETVSSLRLEIPRFAQSLGLLLHGQLHLWHVQFSAEEFRAYVADRKWQTLDVHSPNYLEDPLDILNQVMEPPKPDCLHFIIVQRPDPKSSHSSTKRSRDSELDQDETSPLVKRFHQMLDKISKAKTPSEAVRSNNYGNYQKSLPIYDGRYAIGSSTSTVALPIELYHPVFATFLDDVANDKLEVPDHVLAATTRLMTALTALHPSETARRHALAEPLSHALGMSSISLANRDFTSPDGTIITTLGSPISESVALAIREDKREIGDGGCDPTIQAPLSAARFWVDETHKIIRNNTCCPTFLIANAGPWLAILGVVITDKIMCQHLTDFLWVGVDRVFNGRHSLRVARVLHALGENLRNLKKYYEDLPSKLDLGNAVKLRRFFPSIDTYYDSVQDTDVHFEYIRALEPDPACITFLARTRSPTDPKLVVVKFVERYGEAVHRFLEKRDLAPQLFYFGRVSKSGAPSYCSLRMVVMEYLEGKTVAQLQAETSLSKMELTTQLETIIKLLHANGLVFGDLRGPNVMILRGEKVKLIDFDWGGKFGDVKYPNFLSSDIKWPPGAEGGKLINPQHDLDMIPNVVNLLGP